MKLYGLELGGIPIFTILITDVTCLINEMFLLLGAGQEVINCVHTLSYYYHSNASLLA